MTAKQNDFYSAFFNLQNDLGPIAKNRAGRFKYADLFGIMQILQPLLKKHQFMIHHTMRMQDGITILKTALVHISGTLVDTEVPLRSFEDQAYNDQEVGKNITYLKRYAISALLNITVEDDPDDNDGERSHAISEKQVKLLLARTRGNTDLISRILSSLKVDKLEDIPRNKFNAILEYIDKQK